MGVGACLFFILFLFIAHGGGFFHISLPDGLATEDGGEKNGGNHREQGDNADVEQYLFSLK